MPVDVPKAAIAKELIRVIHLRGLTQTEAGYIIRDQPSQISMIANGHLKGFSVDRLARYLAALGRDIEVKVSPAKRRVGRVRLVVR